MTKRTHTLIGLALGLQLTTTQLHEPIPAFALSGLCALAAIAPDFDIPLGLKHRGITHTVFALVALLALCGYAAPALLIYAVTGYASHILFDMLTVSGVPLFYPNPNRFKLARFRTGGTMDGILGVMAALNALWLIYEVFQ